MRLILFSDAKTYRNENLPDNLRGLCVRSLALLKAIITIETRNGWWNWQGDTGYLWGVVSAFDFSVEKAKIKVEKNRKQGSFFEIKEFPILALEISDTEFLMVSLYESYKHLNSCNMFGASAKVQDIINELHTGARSYMLHAENVDIRGFVSLSENEMLYSYRSSRGTSNTLNWNISRDNASFDSLLSSIKKFNDKCFSSAV